MDNNNKWNKRKQTYWFRKIDQFSLKMCEISVLEYEKQINTTYNANTQQ